MTFRKQQCSRIIQITSICHNTLQYCSVYTSNWRNAQCRTNKGWITFHLAVSSNNVVQLFQDQVYRQYGEITQDTMQSQTRDKLGTVPASPFPRFKWTSIGRTDMSITCDVRYRMLFTSSAISHDQWDTSKLLVLTVQLAEMLYLFLVSSIILRGDG